MSLNLLIKSITSGEILLPKLRHFLEQEYHSHSKGTTSHKEVVKEDALMTISCFQDRLKTYNHHQPVGEYFHPSQLGKCLRALWYAEKGAPQNTKPNGADLLHDHVIFETGTYLHVMFQNLCERAGYLIRREFLTHSIPLRIIGHADGVLEIDGEKYLLEIKTINNRGFSSVAKAPKDDHKKQMMAYMKVLGLKWAIIIYIDKDKAALKEFVIQFSDHFYKSKCAPRIDKHFANLDKSVPPDREGEMPSKMPCSYCSFSRICYDTLANQAFLLKLCKSKEGSKPKRIKLKVRSTV